MEHVDYDISTNSNFLEKNKLHKNESLIIKNALNAIVEFQDKFDAATWQISKSEMGKLRYISLHVSKLS